MRTNLNAVQPKAFWGFSCALSRSLRSTVVVLMAYLLIAFAITDAEREAALRRSNGDQAWCTQEAQPLGPQDDHQGKHPHNASCCVVPDGTPFAGLVPDDEKALEFIALYTPFTRSFGFSQPTGFPASAYSDARAPPRLG